MIMLMYLAPGVLITGDDDVGCLCREHLGRQYSRAVVTSLLIYKEVLKWFTAWLYIALTLTENAKDKKITFHKIPKEYEFEKKMDYCCQKEGSTHDMQI